MEGKRLREMMIEKVNESKGMAGQDATATAFDPNFLSGLLGGNVDSALQGNILKSIPGLHALQQSMPFIKEAWPGTGSGTINRNLSAMNKQVEISITFNQFVFRFRIKKLSLTYQKCHQS